MVIQFSRLGIIKKFLIAFQLLSDLGSRISATAKATPICFNRLSASVRIWTGEAGYYAYAYFKQS